jgi:PAS domain S-box-containing protein
MQATCDFRLAILSMGIAILASFTALDAVEQLLVATGGRRKLWLMGRTAVMGGAIAGVYYALIKLADRGTDFSLSLAIATLVILAIGLQVSQIKHRLKNEATLTESQRRLATLIDSLPGIVFSCSNDPDFSMNYLSKGCLEATGYCSAELMATKGIYNAITHPEDLSRVLETINAAISQQQPYVVEYRIETKFPGDYKWLWEKGNGVYGDRGQLLGLEGFITDITKLKTSETVLRETEAKYRSIFENAVEGIFQSTIEGQYISVNPSLARIYGYESAQTLVSGLTNIEQQLYVEASRRQEFLDLIQRHGAVTGFESQVYRQDRTIIWISENIRVVKDHHGNVLYYEGTVEDITAYKQLHQQLENKVLERTLELSVANHQLKREIAERQQTQLALRASEELYRAVVEQTSDGIVLVDVDNKALLQTNAAYQKMIGYTAAELLQLKADDISALESTTIDLIIQEILTAQNCFRGEVPHRHKDGFLVWCEVNASNIFYGDRQVICVVVRDITERRRAEAEIQSALAKEKELSDLKSRFANMTSHEFRTPLTTILFSAELLQKYGAKWTQAKQEQHLCRIQTSVNRMTQLLDDVLLIGKAEAGKLEFNPYSIDLNQFCQDLVEEIQNTTARHQITFTTKLDRPRAEMDEKLLRHIFSNLLTNAVKYTPQGGTIDFELACQQDDAIFRLRDSGIGIPNRDRAQLFDSFHRASNVGSISGTGLGLAIVKTSVELHGGTITVESEIDVGTTFEVTLPLSADWVERQLSSEFASCPPNATN